MNCPKCGNESNQNYCEQCGTPLEQSNPYVDPSAVNGQPYTPYAMPSYNQKSKMAAGLLGIFLGAWGVHNFYLGYTGKGVLQIVLTLVTCGAASLWGFVEGIIILCSTNYVDASGVPLKD